MALRKLGRFDEAVASSSRAAEMFKTAGDMDAYCQCVGAIGDALLEDGRYSEALEQLLKRYDLASEEGSGMTPTIAAFTLPYALARVGECLGSLGRRAEAITALTEAVAIFEQAQSPDFKHANALERLAAVLAEESRTGESHRTYARAAEVFEAIGDTEASGRCRDLATTAAPAENVIRPGESFGGSYGPGPGGMSEQAGVVVREAVTTA
jgi:tetratricopeptide (TPR) repeat protein